MIDAVIKFNRGNKKIIAQMFCDAINAQITSNLENIKQLFVTSVVNNITNSDEYRSLVSNSPEDYEAEFGTIQIEQTLQEAIKTLSGQHEIFFKPFKAVSGQTISGSFSFNMIESDFEDVVNTEGGTYKSNNFTIPWLRWIILLGDYTIDSYFIDYDLSSNELKRSRSGKATMQRDTGSHWLVPEPFRGDDKENNFITRSIRNMDIQLTNIIIKVLTE